MTDQTKDPVPLPPAELVAEMLNPAGAAQAPAAAPPVAARLEFVGDKAWTKVVPLEFPFRLNGEIVSSVTLRRLTTAEIGEVVDRLGDKFGRWDLVAAMAGLPVEVLRGLEGGDGDEVMEAGFGFLPRRLRA